MQLFYSNLICSDGYTDPPMCCILFGVEICLILKLTNEKKTTSLWSYSCQRCYFIFSALIIVEKVANESQKTPRDVVMMENFHHIFATLSRLKISCLEAEKKEAKQKYTDHLQSYVIYSLGQPLEKLNVIHFSWFWTCVCLLPYGYHRLAAALTLGRRKERLGLGSCQGARHC